MGKEKKHGLLGKILIFFTQTPDFIWRKRIEKQKFDIEQNVMSEQVKMPVRHFLRRDYLNNPGSVSLLSGLRKPQIRF